MAVSMSGEYVGGLNVKIQHGPSGTEITTAAPVDNHGDGSSFSPTDLAASSLGACMLTVMAIVAERDGIDLRGARFELEKHMQSDPRRIGRIPVTLHMPKGLDAKQRKKLERTAMTCPVHKSLHEDTEKAVEFVYPD